MNIIKKDNWDVRLINLKLARSFVEEHHYAHGGANTAVSCFGLFKGSSDELHGISWWMPPAYGAAKYVAEDDHKNVLALSRFCLVDDRPDNSGSFLISKSIKMLDKRWSNLVTYADTALNHNGGLYRASNWSYDGLTGKNPIFVNPVNNQMVSRKKGPKTYNKTEMIEMGFKHMGNFKKHRFLYPRFARKGLVIKSREEDSLVFTRDGKILK